MIRSFVAAGFAAILSLAVLLPAPALAQSQHEQIVAHYGGAYDPDGLGRYVRGIVDRLEPHANLDRPIRYVTVLDSPVINAFATPEGGVYVTRGIVALCNSEDELAGIIGHEIGHVAEGHGERRQGVSILAGLGGLIAESMGVGDLGMLGYNVAANLGLSSYSRDQEGDSDRLGVMYLHQAGYDPYALHDFFGSMNGEAELSQRLAGQSINSNRMDFFSTHPNTEGRIEDAYGRAEGTGLAPGEIPRIVNGFFDEIDGMSYGDGDDQGFVRGRRFYHSEMGFTFEVPHDYKIQNGTESVVAFHDDGSAIVFDMGQGYASKGLGGYVNTQMSQELGVQLRNIQSFTVNGISAASGEATVNDNGRRRDVMVAAFDGGNGRIYRFVMSADASRRSNYDRGWIDTMDSFRWLEGDEADGFYAQVIDVVPVGSNDTVASLSQDMAFDDFREDRFRALNGLEEDGDLATRHRVKLVVN